MKKIFAIFLTLAMALRLFSCSHNSIAPKVISKEGLEPYELSDSDTYLLQSFNIKDNSQIISFHAARNTKTLKVNVYRLKKDHTWEALSGGEVNFGTEKENDNPYAGTFTMLLNKDHSINFNINLNGIASYKTDSVDAGRKFAASEKTFLTDYQQIKMDKEIPVAIMTYSDNSEMRSYNLNDFYSPSEFNSADLVQSVTLTFSDKTD